MINHLDELPDEDIQTDVCVIGAGAAGIAVATEWIGRQHRVVLVESGGFNMDKSNQSLYEGENTGIPYFPLSSCRLRLFGGTTGHWGGACWPIESEVFARRDWVSEDGWPITREELDPYYIRGHKILGLGPYDYSPEYWSEVSGKPTMDPGSRLQNKLYQSSDPILRFGPNYRGNVKKANNINCLLGANLTHIQLKDDQTTVDWIEISSLNKKRLKVRAKYFVLACGGLENPRQLLMQNKQMSEGIGNQHDLVGRYFMEHLFLRTSVAVWNKDVDLSFYKGRVANETYYRGGLGFKAEVEKKEQLLNTWFAINIGWDPPFPAISAMQESLHKRREKDLGMFSELQDYISGTDSEEEENQPTNDQVPYTTLTCISEQSPDSQSRVMIDHQDKDALGQGKIQLDWRVSESDREKIIRAHEVLATELGRTDNGRLRMDMEHNEAGWRSIDSIKEQGDIYGSYHHMGTTRMHDNPNKGVVDKNCRVHGIDNLFVAGSSVFPTVGYTNPTLTICALAFRLADHIDRKLNTVEKITS